MGADPPRSRNPLGVGIPQEQAAPLGAGTPPGSRPPQNSACWETRPTSGRYASYCNAYLFSFNFDLNFALNLAEIFKKKIMELKKGRLIFKVCYFETQSKSSMCLLCLKPSSISCVNIGYESGANSTNLIVKDDYLQWNRTYIWRTRCKIIY